MTADSGSTQPPSSSTGTRPVRRVVLDEPCRAVRQVDVTVSYGTLFSARTMRVRAQYGQRGAS